MSILDSIAKRFGYVPESKLKTAPPKREFAAAKINRLVNDWVIGPGPSKNEKIRRGLVNLRARARDLCENDDYAKKFISLCKNNIVGPNGIALQMDVTEMDGTPDDRANDQIEEAWSKWCRKENCTVTGNLTFVGLQNLLIESAPQDGEFLVRKVRARLNPFNFSLQPLPIDALDESYNSTLPNGNTVRMGVERDAWKRPVAYHVLTTDPSDTWFNGNYRFERERIPASEIIHGFIPASVNQVRGFPWFHTALLRLKMLNGYEEAAVVAARVGACKMGFITQSVDASEGYKGDGTDDDGNIITEAEPGTIEALAVGQGFQAFDPDYPHQNYGPFVKSVLRGISSGLGVSYNSLATDLEGVNYSSIRAGLLEERDNWMALQGWFIDTFITPVFEEWLTCAIDTGAIRLPVSKLEKFNRPKWMPRRWAWVDPEKDINASITAIEAGLSTRSEELASQGRDINNTFRTLSREEKLAKEYGLTFKTKNSPPPAKAEKKTETEME